MTKEQVKLINWMYFAIITSFQFRNDEHSSNDSRLLKEAIHRRFPEHADVITMKFIE